MSEHGVVEAALESYIRGDDRRNGATTGMTFKGFQRINKDRSDQFFSMCLEWSSADWAMALTGELGELCNLLKKRRRGLDVVSKESISAELADVCTYLFLLASHEGVDLEDAVRLKFNEVSKRVDAHQRL